MKDFLKHNNEELPEKVSSTAESHINLDNNLKDGNSTAVSDTDYAEPDAEIAEEDFKNVLKNVTISIENTNETPNSDGN